MDAPQPLTPESLVPRIGAYLVEKGLISLDDLCSALTLQQDLANGAAKPPLLGQILLQMGKISREMLDQAITEQILRLRVALEQSNQQLEERVKARTARLEQVMLQLAETNKEKAHFISNVSHEFRTPLTHIKGYCGLLEEESAQFSETQREALDIILRAADRLEQLIEDLILFADSERDRLTLDRVDFSIARACKRIYELASPRAAEKEIVLKYNPPAEPALVYGDEAKIGWVISHLLDNAIKFTNMSGEISITIEKQDQTVKVSICDTGIGIPPEKLHEIFEPFHQLDGSTTRKYGGTGLGLSLAKRILELHGSSLQVASQVGCGSTFEFLLHGDQSGGQKSFMETQ